VEALYFWVTFLWLVALVVLMCLSIAGVI